MSAIRLHLRSILGWASVVALLTFPLFSVSGALDMFLKIDGVKGESRDSKHKDEIDILSWSWGVSNAGKAGGGNAGGGKAKPNVQEISFTKYLDKASPTLILHALNGKSFKSATLSISKANKSSPGEFLKIKLEDVIVTSISSGGSGGQDQLTENVTLDFRRFELEYRETKRDGKLDTAKKVTYDSSTNKAN